MISPSKRSRLWLLLLSLAASLLLVVFSVHAAVSTAASVTRAPTSAAAVSPGATGNGQPVANCRYGISTAAQGGQHKTTVPTLGAGWYLSFGAQEPQGGVSNNAEYVHIIRTKQDKDAQGNRLPSYTISPKLEVIRYTLKQTPGALWLIGNEVDRIDKQDDIFPELYAEAYHEVYRFIKRHDPTARMAISALVQVTPGRLQYLDKVWSAYQQKYGRKMPVDVYNIHLYVLPEADLIDGQIVPNDIANVALGTDLNLAILSSRGDQAKCVLENVACVAEHDDMINFGRQVRDMRQWMKSKGERNKPLIVTEYSILYPVIGSNGLPFLDEFDNQFTPERIRFFMLNSFHYLSNTVDVDLGYPRDDNKLVQQWLWFTAYTQAEGRASNLFESDYATLTELGETYRDHVYNEPAAVNLKNLGPPPIYGGAFGQPTTDVSMLARFVNNGNHSPTIPFTVTFYSDAARSQVINSTVISPDVRGCATSVTWARATWADLSPGEYQYWLHIDSSQALTETLEADNYGTGQITIAGEGTLLPVLTVD